MRMLWVLLWMCVLVPVVASGEMPAAPETATKAKALGLKQLDVPALRKTFVGVMSEQDVQGRQFRVEYGTDGSVILSNTTEEIDRGTFSVTRQNGGGVCLRLEQQMNQRFCTVWFASEQGGHLFGYNTRDGSIRAVATVGRE